jgi:predicted 3-demethylubiquinone-9 3-methyltransferase (glyoxalase superfamily)
MATLQKIVPNLWFNRNAEEAVNHYMTIFKQASIRSRTYYSKAGYEIHKMPEGTVLTIEFSIEGHDFVALNAGDEFKFNESISFIVNCETQEEIDFYWTKLSEEGDPAAQVCGWLKDKFGVSWQIVPTEMQEMMKSGEDEKINRMMSAMFKMKKLDLKKLKDAYNEA